MRIRKRKVAEEAPPSSAQIVASIDDLLTEILLRLPIRSLVRFRLVSHHWHSLLLTPQFDPLLNPHPNPAIGLIFPSSMHDLSYTYTYTPFSLKNSRKDPPLRKLNFAPEPTGIQILQSCNGLLLCSSDHENDCNRKYYVYNPTTKKFSTLPKLGGNLESTAIQGMNLAFNPAKSPHYRAICVRRRRRELGYSENWYRYEIEVHSSEAGPTWKRCGVPFRIEADFGVGTYWNGGVHWIGEGGACWYFNPDHRKPEIRAMPPVAEGWDGCSGYLVESCDHLHYISEYRCPLNVYEMKRDYSEWFPKYRVADHFFVTGYGIVRHYSSLSPRYPGFQWDYVFPVFTLVRGEREEDSFLALQNTRKAVRYNLVDGTFETILELEEGGCDEIRGFRRGFQYIESLCCLY